jgi:hypothetical protein
LPVHTKSNLKLTIRLTTSTVVEKTDLKIHQQQKVCHR